jgi:peptidoglycan-associated lipoprotein
MKVTTPFALLLTATMALSLGTVGCRKKPDRLTNIPGTGPGARVGLEETAPPIGTGGTATGPGAGTGGVTAVPPGEAGIPMGNKDFSTWKQDRSTFADQTVLFDFDKSNVRPDQVGKLEEVARRMKTMPGKALLIEGHCDERGTEEYNRSLGDRRALSVREWLAGHGVPSDMITTVSFGEDKPVDPGHDDAAWKKNRRGEIILLSP